MSSRHARDARRALEGCYGRSRTGVQGRERLANAKLSCERQDLRRSLRLKTVQLLQMAVVTHSHLSLLRALPTLITTPAHRVPSRPSLALPSKTPQLLECRWR
jgi:hypothetical protein